MAAGSYSFTIEQGATVDFEIQYLDSGSNPIDLSGTNQFLEMRIRQTYGGDSLAELTSSLIPSKDYAKSSSLAFLSVSGSDLATTPTSGSIGVYIGHELTDAFTFDKAFYDIELTSGQARTRIVQGRIKLSRDIT